MNLLLETPCLVAAATVGPFQENQYLLACPQTRHAVILDPGAPASSFLPTVASLGLSLQAIWLTHGHIDHVAGLFSVHQAHPLPIFLHPDDAPVLASAEQVGRMYGWPIDPPPAATDPLADGQGLTLGTLEIEVLHLPGHSPGHVGFYLPHQQVLISGDVLFRGSVGRTDLPGGSWPVLAGSLRRLMQLPDETRVFAGHMDPTTIGRERRSNPFVAQALDE